MTVDDLRARELSAHRDVMIDYLNTRLALRDWHGVRDACVDIEVLEARIAQLKDPA